MEAKIRISFQEELVRNDSDFYVRLRPRVSLVSRKLSKEDTQKIVDGTRREIRKKTKKV